MDKSEEVERLYREVALEEIERLYKESALLNQRIKELVTAYEKRTGRSPFHKTGGYVGEPWDSTVGH